MVINMSLVQLLCLVMLKWICPQEIVLGCTRVHLSVFDIKSDVSSAKIPFQCIYRVKLVYYTFMDMLNQVHQTQIINSCWLKTPQSAPLALTHQ